MARSNPPRGGGGNSPRSADGGLNLRPGARNMPRGIPLRGAPFHFRTQTMQDIAPVNWLRIAFLGVIWGASFLFTALALREVGPLSLAAARVTLGAMFLVALSFARGTKLPPLRGGNAGRIWAFALAMALFSNAVPFSLLGWGQQVVASGFAGVCMSAVPLLILPLAHVFVPGERLTLRRLVGFVMGTAGVVVLIGPAAFAPSGSDWELLAKLACVGA